MIIVKNGYDFCQRYLHNSGIGDYSAMMNQVGAD